jgi:hypothetical protein
MKDYHNIRDSYKLYKETVDNPVDIKIYISIVNGFMKFLIRRLFEKGELLLPERLGKLFIIGKKVNVKIQDGKIKGLAPDWASTKELWESDPEAKANKVLIYHFNEETNGIRYKIFWSKERVLVPNKTLYNLRMTRKNKRTISKIIKSGKEFLIKN